jgi:hypothetical protein
MSCFVTNGAYSVSEIELAAMMQQQSLEQMYADLAQIWPSLEQTAPDPGVHDLGQMWWKSLWCLGQKVKVSVRTSSWLHCCCG